jgi:pimeloyl-ACP methyl ester carboxylesterase
MRLPATLTFTLTFLFTLPLTTHAQIPPPPAKRLPPAGIAIPAPDRTELTTATAALATEISTLRADLTASQQTALLALLPDVEIFHKAVDWALRYDEFFAPKEVATARHLLALGRERAAQLRAGRAPWLDATGLVLRGYRSKLDDSIQPYGLVIPAGWQRTAPGRLQVWLLGRGEKRTELAFLAEREAKAPEIVPAHTLVLIPYGRFCNATKFAGEVDVFEAMDAVRREHAIDPLRTSVAGFSMGGASTWHLATHHPGLWSSASPGAGFAEVANYQRAYLAKEPPTWWEQKLWNWYSATTYAGNLFNVPTIAYSGELDPQKASADLMEQAMAADGLKLERLIGPKTAHKYEPATKKELVARLEKLADTGRDATPREIRFSTYTLRYAESGWVKILGLEKHWERADVRARLSDDAKVISIETQNVAALHLAQMRVAPRFRGTVLIDGQNFTNQAVHDDSSVLVKRAGMWAVTFGSGYPPNPSKRPGLTGPIDDAFLEPLRLRPPHRRSRSTPASARGPPANSPTPPRCGATSSAATHSQRRHRRHRRRPRPSHLVLWGDPSSNRLLARLLPQLPLQWDARTLRFRGQDYDAAHHAPVLIFPNPLNPARYVVLNSGIDFREHGYGTNSLQVPEAPRLRHRRPPRAARPPLARPDRHRRLLRRVMEVNSPISSRITEAPSEFTENTL